MLLIDEPFSGLDRRLTERMLEETITILHETRATCIASPITRRSPCDRVALLRGGTKCSGPRHLLAVEQHVP
jgi:iron(III) transport system ATP-binding protein